MAGRACHIEAESACRPQLLLNPYIRLDENKHVDMSPYRRTSANLHVLTQAMMGDGPQHCSGVGQNKLDSFSEPPSASPLLNRVQILLNSFLWLLKAFKNCDDFLEQRPIHARFFRNCSIYETTNYLKSCRGNFSPQ